MVRSGAAASRTTHSSPPPGLVEHRLRLGLPAAIGDDRRRVGLEVGVGGDVGGRGDALHHRIFVVGAGEDALRLLAGQELEELDGFVLVRGIGRDPAAGDVDVGPGAGLAGDNGPLRVAPYAAEAGQFQQAGFSTVICGPGSIAQAHKADEYVELDQLDACLEMIGNLLPQLA